MQQYQHIFDGKLVKRDNISNARTYTHTYFRNKTNALKDRCTHTEQDTRDGMNG